MTLAGFKKVFNPDEWEFVFQQRNEHRYLIADFWTRSLFQEHASQLKLESESEDVLFFSDSKSYARKRKRKHVLNVVREAVNADEKYLHYVHDTTLARVEAFESFASGIAARIAQAANRQTLAEMWQQHDDVLLVTIPWFYIPWYITEENMISDRVQAGLEKHKAEVVKIAEQWSAVQALITPTKKMMFQDEQQDFYALVELAAKDKLFLSSKTFSRRADEYLEKHAWMKTFFVLPIEPLTRDELTQRIKDALQQDSLSEYQEQEGNREESRKLAKALMMALRSDKQLVSDIVWAQEYGWLLTWSVELALRTAATLQPFYKKVAKEIGVSFDDFSHLTSSEILDCLRGNSDTPKDQVESRKEAYVLLYDNGKATVVAGKQAQPIIKWVTDEINKIGGEVSEFKGQAASPGLARGKVRLVPYAQDAGDLQEGEILVCSMTSPDYVPAMKRAVAIVTDEGGLLSHAAIVSRELGKPCVIGTKIATRALKSGDEVEVDADGGVVRILDQAE